MRWLAIVLGVAFLAVIWLLPQPMPSHLPRHRFPVRLAPVPNPALIDWLAEAEYQLDGMKKGGR